MTEIREKLLELSTKEDISKFTLREIGEKIGVKHPQTVKNNIIRLRELGLLKMAKRDDFFKEVQDSKITDAILYKVPIFGYASCGTATLLAEEDFQGYLTLSTSILKKRTNMFALIASGNSMNMADIDGESIDDGDYVIVDRDYTSPRNGDYVLSVIDGSANIKRFYKDGRQDMITLLSESSENHDPIFIHESDFSSYFINGKVIKVIKKPTIT
jgi:repressor LexA